MTKPSLDPTALERTLHRTFQMLYLQFVFYWATIAAGMFVNYYYVVPDSVTPDVVSIFGQFIAAPSLFAHVLFAVLSSGMSIPVILLARRAGLTKVIYLHLGAISARLVGFVCGPLFIYYSTGAIGDGASAGLTTFIMASVFLVAVILTFMSRIFIVREDVRIRYGAISRPLGAGPIGS